jgi:hypothetical protein
LVNVIGAPIEQVFDFAANPANLLPVLPPGATVRQETPGPIGAGTVFLYQVGRRTTRVFVEDYVRPTRLAVSWGRQRAVDTYSRQGPDTRVISEVKWPYVDAPVWMWPILAPLTPLLRYVVKSTSDRTTELARTVLEDGWTPSRSGRKELRGRWRRLVQAGAVVVAGLISFLVTNRLLNS